MLQSWFFKQAKKRFRAWFAFRLIIFHKFLEMYLIVMTQWITAHAIVAQKMEPMSMMKEPEIKRWTAKRKVELIKQIYRGQTTIAEAARPKRPRLLVF